MDNHVFYAWSMAYKSLTLDIGLALHFLNKNVKCNKENEEPHWALALVGCGASLPLFLLFLFLFIYLVFWVVFHYLLIELGGLGPGWSGLSLLDKIVPPFDLSSRCGESPTRTGCLIRIHGPILNTPFKFGTSQLALW